MKVSLNFGQQNAVYLAFTKFDAYEVVAEGGKVARVPFKLGAHRRIIAKNMVALRTHLETFNEARSAVIKEIWPDKSEGVDITAETDPVNFPKFVAEMAKMSAAKEEIELSPLPASVMYSDSNDFPTDALVELEAHGLIEG